MHNFFYFKFSSLVCTVIMVLRQLIINNSPHDNKLMANEFQKKYIFSSHFKRLRTVCNLLISFEYGKIFFLFFFMRLKMFEKKLKIYFVKCLYIYIMMKKLNLQLKIEFNTTKKIFNIWFIIVITDSLFFYFTCSISVSYIFRRLVTPSSLHIVWLWIC